MQAFYRQNLPNVTNLLATCKLFTTNAMLLISNVYYVIMCYVNFAIVWFFVNEYVMLLIALSFVYVVYVICMILYLMSMNVVY